MITKKMFPLLLLTTLLFITNQMNAQLFSGKKANWVSMMNDPNVNYFEAVENFENYWKNREKPEEEGEFFNDSNAKNNRHKKRKKPKYAEEYKKFVNWQREMLPFVQEDGHILSPEERLKIWEKEKKSRN